MKSESYITPVLVHRLLEGLKLAGLKVIKDIVKIVQVTTVVQS